MVFPLLTNPDFTVKNKTWSLLFSPDVNQVTGIIGNVIKCNESSLHTVRIRAISVIAEF